MCMEPVSHVLPGCYKATVNEPETIMAAQPFRPGLGCGIAVSGQSPPIERS